MKTNTIKEIIKKSIKDAYVEVIDLNNSGDHFSLLVVTNQFDALNILNRHKIIYNLFDNYITKEIHALQLKTLTYKEYNNEKLES